MTWLNADAQSARGGLCAAASLLLLILAAQTAGAGSRREPRPAMGNVRSGQDRPEEKEGGRASPLGDEAGPVAEAERMLDNVSLSGRIVVGMKGRELAIDVGGRGESRRPGKFLRLRRRVSLNDVRPLWERVDGRPISEDPAYRGRKFTKAGQLVGKPLDMTLRLELAVKAPDSLGDLRARVVIEDLAILAHEYTTDWGRVEQVRCLPTEVGRLPARTLTASRGRVLGPCVSRVFAESQWLRRAGRSDVVRLAGFAFGLKCTYRIELDVPCRRQGAGAVEERRQSRAQRGARSSREPHERVRLGGSASCQGNRGPGAAGSERTDGQRARSREAMDSPSDCTGSLREPTRAG